MPANYKTDEIIDIVLQVLYHNGDYKKQYLDVILQDNDIALNERDLAIIEWKIMESRFAHEIGGFPMDKRDTRHEITDSGIEMMRRHKSYLGYVRHQKWALRREGFQTAFTTGIKTTASFVAICATLVTISLGIYTLRAKIDSESQAKQIQRITATLDSMRVILQPKPIH
jgi:hypothetical protein